MKANLVAVVMFVVATLAWTQSSQAQDSGATPPAPVEAFFCNMQPGKDMKDLMQVTERFNKWAAKNDPGYSAWILTPRFGQFGDLPEVVWLGSSQSGNDMGKGLDAWMAGGNDIQGAFDGVMSCGSHSLVSSVEVNAPSLSLNRRDLLRTSVA